MYAARTCLPHDNGFGFVYAAPLFVGEAYMPGPRAQKYLRVSWLTTLT